VEGLWESSDAAAEGPRFRVVLRGYDRHQVDECVRALKLSGTPAREFIHAVEGFDVVLRGYDRREVDRYLKEFRR
jgi:DivIVA domain-containing protein